jgi:short chain dehydrogenase
MDKDGGARRPEPLSRGTGATAPVENCCTKQAARAVMRPQAEPVAGPYPVPPPERSAGPIAPGRGSSLAGKIAIVTGAARGIGRAIAVEFAANGADVVAIDIAGPVSPTADAIPATEAELEETVADIRHYGRRAMAIKADIRDIAALRRIADEVETAYGKIDIVVANAAIQGWKPLMEMNDNDARLRSEDGRAQKGPLHPVGVHAGTHGHEGWRRLLCVEVGHSRPNEVGCAGARHL